MCVWVCAGTLSVGYNDVSSTNFCTLPFTELLKMEKKVKLEEFPKLHKTDRKSV